MAKSKLTFRLFESRDAEKLSQLLLSVVGRERPPSYWTWRFESNPGGPHTAYVAEDPETGKIVGCQSDIPIRYQFFGEPIVAWHLEDVMVEPAYRSRGTYWTLYKLCEAEFIRLQMAFATGTPAPEYEKITTHMMKGRRLCPLPTVVCGLRSKAALPGRLRRSRIVLTMTSAADPIIHLHRRLRMPRAGNEAILKIERFDGRFDRFWRQAKSEHPIAITRDSVYLNWRYVENPWRQYSIFAVERAGEIAGFAVVSEAERGELLRGQIAELMAQVGDDDAVAALLSACFEHTAHQSPAVDSLNGWFLENYPWRPLLERAGFRFRPHPERFVIVRPLALAHEEDRLLDAANWFLTGGDFDEF